MYLIYNIDEMNHLFNKSKKKNCSYNTDRMVYLTSVLYIPKFHTTLISIPKLTSSLNGQP